MVECAADLDSPNRPLGRVCVSVVSLLVAFASPLAAATVPPACRDSRRRDERGGGASCGRAAERRSEPAMRRFGSIQVQRVTILDRTAPLDGLSIPFEFPISSIFFFVYNIFKFQSGLQCQDNGCFIFEKQGQMHNFEK